jgi:3-oxoacyl-[acyl-carrier protein] reductase
MSDFLLEMGRNPQARKVIKSLGLPLTLPETLKREKGPWRAQPLADARVAVGAAPGALLLDAVAHTLGAMGAQSFVANLERDGKSFQGPGEVFGRPAKPLSSDGAPGAWRALVFDASGIKEVGQLRALYDFFHPIVPQLGRSGRIVVVAQAESAAPEHAAVVAGIVGFVRSLSKEIGRGGSTANVVLVQPKGEKYLEGALRFFLSARSAFVTGQPLTVAAPGKPLAEPPYVRCLDGKVALVTGAARGIGAATAKALAQEGARVVCLDRPDDSGPLSQLAREIGGVPLAVDMGKEDAATEIRKALLAQGGVDVVVHNAGITRDKTLARMKEDGWDSVIRVNLEAVVRTTEALLQEGLKDGGRVILLSSVAGIAGNTGQTNYAASKAALLGYLKALSSKVASRGITVNAIAPGFIETRMTAAIPFAIREAARRLSSLSQGGRPEDVAQAITFLASPGSQGVTGQHLRVCGGALIGA